MGTPAFIGLCIGATVGLRFTVLALFPVMLLGVAMVTARGLAAGQPVWAIVLMNVVGAICLQFGYLVGTLLSLLGIAGSRAENPQPFRPSAQ